MRIGIIGTGSMGRTHAASWATTPATLAGFVSRSGVASLADEYSVPTFATLEAMLPHVDVVDVCTPTPQHLAQTLTAARAGKHVICEKPIARTLHDADAMLAICAEHNVQLLMAHVLRFFPAYSDAYAKLMSGAIGALREVRLLRAGYAPHKPNDNWFADLEQSGGPMLDLMIHDFDYARWLAGDVVGVSARANGGGRTLADHAFVTLTHANGVVSHIEGGWHLGPGEFKTQLRVVGDAGAIDSDADLSTPADRASAVPNVRPAGPDPYALQAQACYDAIAHNKAMPVSARDGVEALRIALAALQAARSGATVSLP